MLRFASEQCPSKLCSASRCNVRVRRRLAMNHHHGRSLSQMPRLLRPPFGPTTQKDCMLHRWKPYFQVQKNMPLDFLLRVNTHATALLEFPGPLSRLATSRTPQNFVTASASQSLGGKFWEVPEVKLSTWNLPKPAKNSFLKISRWKIRTPERSGQKKEKECEGFIQDSVQLNKGFWRFCKVRWGRWSEE